jgi:hypothetical protein
LIARQGRIASRADCHYDPGTEDLILYDLDGWTVPDPITPEDVNLVLRRPR